MTFEIKKGIPLPDRYRIYPFNEMQVGDCFDVPTDKQSKVISAASKYGKDKGIKFTSKRMKQDGNIFIRIWRIS